MSSYYRQLHVANGQLLTSHFYPHTSNHQRYGKDLVRIITTCFYSHSSTRDILAESFTIDVCVGQPRPPILPLTVSLQRDRRTDAFNHMRWSQEGEQGLLQDHAHTSTGVLDQRQRLRGQFLVLQTTAIEFGPALDEHLTVLVWFHLLEAHAQPNLHGEKIDNTYHELSSL